MSWRKITNGNGFRARRALEGAARNPLVSEIEGGGCEKGRVFVHLVKGWWFEIHQCSSKTVGNAAELADLMRQIKPAPR
jgi:hypothetical protein